MSSNATAAASAAPSTKPGLDSTFLNLLVKELQNQDPTAPMDSTAMVGQMISLNQLDQLISINQTVTTGSAKKLASTGAMTGMTAAQVVSAAMNHDQTAVSGGSPATKETASPGQFQLSHLLPFQQGGAPASIGGSADPAMTSIDPSTFGTPIPYNISGGK